MAVGQSSLLLRLISPQQPSAATRPIPPPARRRAAADAGKGWGGTHHGQTNRGAASPPTRPVDPRSAHATPTRAALDLTAACTGLADPPRPCVQYSGGGQRTVSGAMHSRVSLQVPFGRLVLVNALGAELEGALQYQPRSVGEDTQLPARTVPQPVPPWRIELGVSGSSMPPGAQQLFIRLPIRSNGPEASPSAGGGGE
jgi:hypothetical protein